MDEFQGKRLPDGGFPENPGEYVKTAIERHVDGVVGPHTAWLMKAPKGGPTFHIGAPNPDGSPRHEVEENEDGTITVQPHPKNSNSILVHGGTRHEWHGYIYSGVWRSV